MCWPENVEPPSSDSTWQVLFSFLIDGKTRRIIATHGPLR